MAKRKLIFLFILALLVAGCASEPAEPAASVDQAGLLEPAVVVYRPPT